MLKSVMTTSLKRCPTNRSINPTVNSPPPRHFESSNVTLLINWVWEMSAANKLYLWILQSTVWLVCASKESIIAISKFCQHIFSIWYFKRICVYFKPVANDIFDTRFSFLNNNTLVAHHFVHIYNTPHVQARRCVGWDNFVLSFILLWKHFVDNTALKSNIFCFRRLTTFKVVYVCNIVLSPYAKEKIKWIEHV